MVFNSDVSFISFIEIFSSKTLISVWEKIPQKEVWPFGILGAPDLLLICRSQTMFFSSGIVAGSARRVTGKRWQSQITIIVNFYQGFISNGGRVLLSKTVTLNNPIPLSDSQEATLWGPRSRQQEDEVSLWHVQVWSQNPESLITISKLGLRILNPCFKTKCSKRSSRT